jgi:hypothetical protein
VVPTPLKNISQLGDYSQYMEKYQLFQTTNQIISELQWITLQPATFAMGNSAPKDRPA